MATVKVRTLRRDPISVSEAAHVAALTGQRANVLAMIEYRYVDEGFAIIIERVPMRYDESTGRGYTHARISRPLHKHVGELAEIARRRSSRFPVVPLSPLVLRAELSESRLAA